MPTQDDRDLSKLLQSQVDAWDADDAWDTDNELFKGLRRKYDDEAALIGNLRRRRRRVGNTTDEPIKTVSLVVREDGLLEWCDDVPESAPAKLGLGPRRRRLRRRAELPPVEGPAETRDGSLVLTDRPVVLTRTFPVVDSNGITEAIGRIDTWLNPALNPSLRSRLRPLHRAADGTFVLGNAVAGDLDGRTLLFVHGTFSNAKNMLAEFTATEEGLNFLGAAMIGETKYNNVVFFEHATLAVSPVINALELGRFFANASGQIDVIAHSRGGLVVRWWLEAFGRSLAIVPTAPVRAVLVGSPLNGTSLAAPGNLKNVLNLLSNIGAFMQATLNLVGPANPFIWGVGKLVQVVVSAAGALANTPLVDGAIVLVPGLSGQSRVTNNIEINSLRDGPSTIDPRYYAVQSNFETTVPRWQFWKYFRKDVLVDKATNVIFDGPNDLVVDTASMIDFGVPNLQLAAPPRDFGTTDHIWHCNYFRQRETIQYIAQHFT